MSKPYNFIKKKSKKLLLRALQKKIILRTSIKTTTVRLFEMKYSKFRIAKIGRLFIM